MKYLRHTSSVDPFPSVGQRRQNRTLSAISRQQGDPSDRSTMLPPRRKVRVREGRPRESEARRSPRRQDAARPLGGGFKYTEMGLRFRASKARKPYPLGRYARNPFRGKGFLRLPLLVLFSSEDEKSTPKANRYSRNNILRPKKQTGPAVSRRQVLFYYYLCLNY